MDERLKEIDKQFRGMPDTWHYREDVVHLLDAIKRLTEERNSYRREAMNERELTSHIVAEREELIIENERLKDALTVAGKRIDSYQD